MSKSSNNLTTTNLTAAEGADRVHRRALERRRKTGSFLPDEYEEGETEYTCEGCGCHEFNVVTEYVRRTVCREELACDCEGSFDGVAALKCWHRDEVIEETTELRWDHRYSRSGDLVVLDDLGVEIDDEEVNCSSCTAEADADDWDVEEEDVETLDHEFSVRCAGCGREIEFGWSHPDRGGRIWPVEANDHNPFKSWPEPRYHEDWENRGWLRPIGPERAE